MGGGAGILGGADSAAFWATGTAGTSGCGRLSQLHKSATASMLIRMIAGIHTFLIRDVSGPSTEGVSAEIGGSSGTTRLLSVSMDPDSIGGTSIALISTSR